LEVEFRYFNVCQSLLNENESTLVVLDVQ
jgi:hypothetical protein